MTRIPSMTCLFLCLLVLQCLAAENGKPLRSLQVELPSQEHNAVKTSWPAIG